jgi:hypothetical protein
MRRIRRIAIIAGLFVLALLPAAAAVSLEAAAPARLPLAIAQPFATFNAPLAHAWHSAGWMESGLLMLVGVALFGLASIVRRSTSADTSLSGNDAAAVLDTSAESLTGCRYGRVRCQAPNRRLERRRTESATPAGSPTQRGAGLRTPLT